MSHPSPSPRSAVVAVAAILFPFALFAGCTSTVLETTTTSGSTGATGTTTGTMGTGGAGCVPGTLVDCYTGAPGTENVGLCHGGAKKCEADGVTFGPCQWEVTPQKEDCTTAADEDCDGLTPPCAGATVWSESFGSSGNEYGQVVALDPGGDVLVAGGYNAPFMLGPVALPGLGQDDFFVARLAPNGKVLWARGFGSSGKDYVSGIAVDPQGNVVVTGSVAGSVDLGGGMLVGAGSDDIFLLKLDAMGSFVWGKLLGGPQSDSGYGITVDAAGNIFTAGAYDGPVDLGTGPLPAAGSTDIYVARFSPDGQAVWARGYGGAAQDYGSGVALDAAGELFVVGGFLGPVDFGTGPLTTTGYYDGFVAKLDQTGKTVWVKQLRGVGGSGNYPLPASVAVTPTGAVVAGGYFYGQVDFGGGALTSAGGSDAFLTRFDASGGFVYGKRFGGSYVYPGQPTTVTDAILALAVDAKDEAVIAGAYIDTIDFGGGPLAKAPYGNAFLARLDATGQQVFAKGYGSEVSYVEVSGLALRPSGNAVLTGSFSGTVDLGTGPLSSQSTQDADLFVFETGP